MHEQQARGLPHAIALLLQRFFPWVLFGALFLTVAGLALLYELDLPSSNRTDQPLVWTGEQRDTLIVVFLAAGTLFALAQAASYSSAKLRTYFQRSILNGILAVLVFASGVVYFYGALGSNHSFPHLHDSYHYLLGAKYYAELGYDGLYDCTFEALGPSVVPNRTRIRDLRTDEHTTVGVLRNQATGARCKQAFTPERWELFVHDLRVYTDIHPRTLSGLLADRGYNGSPFHTFVAQAVANAIPLSYAMLSVLILLDVLSVCVALAAICQGFGHRAGLLVALLFFCQFVDRFQIIGGSFLRYQWFLALCLGLAFLKRERFFAAGIALTISAFLNVFPVLFCIPIVFFVAFSLLRKHRLSPSLSKLVQGASLAAVLCTLLGAAHAEGFQNYRNFKEAMRVHNAVGRAPGFAVGLKINFVSASEDGKHSTSARSRQLKEARPAIVTTAALFLIAALYISLQIGFAEGAILVGFCGLFCVFGPTGYYYLFSPLLLLLWPRKTWDSGGLWMQSLLFALSIPPYLALLNGAHHFYVFNRVVSGIWTAYLVITLGALLLFVRRHKRTTLAAQSLAFESAQSRPDS